MSSIRYTLVSDGVTDACLIPIIDWTLKESAKIRVSQGTHAELWRLKIPPKTLADRMAQALEHYPCDVLFVHRDAEKESKDRRIVEIREAFDSLAANIRTVPLVPVVPVRMLEAWLAFDISAVRHAAGNPAGRVPLELPGVHSIEACPDPKAELESALRLASELTGRRLKKFHVRQAFWRIVANIDDFSPLRALPAFKTFESSVRALGESDWKPGVYPLER